MNLMMYLGNDLIESIPLSEEKISQPGYLGSFKRQLKTRYADLVGQSGLFPEFLVVRMSQQLAA